MLTAGFEGYPKKAPKREREMDCMDRFCDNQEFDIWCGKHNKAGWSFNQKWKAQREVNQMRDAAWKIRFNAEQFNRRADWMRNTGRKAEEAAAMFPAAQ
jgi:hypothetical protein